MSTPAAAWLVWPVNGLCVALAALAVLLTLHFRRATTKYNSDSGVGAKRLSGVFLFASLCLLATLLTAIASQGVDPMTRSHPDFAIPDWDHHKYIGMAEGPLFGEEKAPFNKRVLTPLLVKALPLDTQSGFRFVTFTCLAVTGVALFYALRSIGFSGLLALIGALFFFSLSWAVDFNLYDFWLTDSMTFVLLCLCVWAAAERKDVLFAALLVVGAANKEAALCALGLFYGLRADAPFDPRALFRTALVGLPATSVLLSLQLALPSGGYSYWESARIIVPQRLDALSLDTLVHLYTLGVFGVPLVALSFFALRSRSGAILTLRLSPFFALVYFQVLFAVNTERLLVLGFPAAIALALVGIREVCGVFGAWEGWFIFLPIIVYWLGVSSRGFGEVYLFEQALILLVFLAVIFIVGGRRAAPNG